MRSSAGMGRVSGAMRRWTRFFLPMVFVLLLLQLHSDGVSASNDSARGTRRPLTTSRSAIAVVLRSLISLADLGNFTGR